MAGTGAPEGNSYARKARKGQHLGIYLTVNEVKILKELCEDQGVEPSTSMINSIARVMLKDAIQRDKRSLKKQVQKAVTENEGEPSAA